MSLTDQLLRAAGAAPGLLRDARPVVVSFLRGQLTDDGGAVGRDGRTDIYYTAFALQGLAALGADWPRNRVQAHLDRFGGGDGLDLVHLAALARCRACVGPTGHDRAAQRELVRRIHDFRSADGGFARTPGQESGTVFECFLSWGAIQDTRTHAADPVQVAKCVQSCRSADGGYANSPGHERGTTAATAAAVAVLRDIGAPVDRAVGAWLLDRRGEKGGFLAAPRTPMPDLLSTAVALHALVRMNVHLDQIRQSTIEFVDTLWHPEGGFFAHWGDDALDCEYTFYGLLALGHLAQ